MKIFFATALITVTSLAGSLAQSSRSSHVSIIETDSSFTLSNAIVSARVSKRSGDLTSLRYKGLEMLDTQSPRGSGYWSHDLQRGQRTTQITIDPRSNGSERGEVSLKGISGGNAMGNGPGGSVIADIEIRYALGRNDSGIYTYSIFSHPTNYPGTSVGEARFCAKLNDDIFDWMTVDANRNMKMITTYDWNHGTVMNMKEARRMNTGIYKGMVEHKYDYSANQFDVRTWGWSSTEKHVGIWFINASVEYLSGGPTKVELSAHRDATFNTNALDAPAPPCLLNYWRGSHYGGSICTIGANEYWTKVIGPFLIYCNSGETPNAMWKEALAKGAKEEKAWPYEWVSDESYPHKDERATVNGQLSLDDPQAPTARFKNLLVGLSAPDYTPARINRGGGRGGFGGGFSLAGGGDDEATTTNQTPSTSLSSTGGESARPLNNSTNTSGRRGGFGGGGGGFNFGPRIVEWQNDAKYYEFWVHGDARGNFSIPNIHPGTYTLHAFADGVLGEFALTNVTIRLGQNLSLGKLKWQPVRYGKQLWEIGVPNRAASEFFKGDDYFHWGWYLEYPKLFPNDVNFVVGRSDYRTDWFFEQVPHNENPHNVTGTGTGRSNTWTVVFTLPNVPHGKATLRLAICGVGTRSLAATMNGKAIGTLSGLVYNATINRDGIGGSWIERDLSFDASLMKSGSNMLELTIPGGGLTSGIMYDYLRLELDEHVSVAVNE
jgi:rhamnogalacturonan endolyase